MQILQELESLIPPLSNEEFKQLERNILEEGIRDPLITWNGILIDGHNRYRIAQKHDLNYETIEKEFENIFLVKVWMIYNQFGRRNLSNYQRSVLALELEDVFKLKAKENQGNRNDIKQLQVYNFQKYDVKQTKDTLKCLLIPIHYMDEICIDTLVFNSNLGNQAKLNL